MTLIRDTTIKYNAADILTNAATTYIPVDTDSSTDSISMKVSELKLYLTNQLTPFTAPIATKGAILGHDGSVLASLLVGTNGQVLSADSTATVGLKWLSLLTTKGQLLGHNGTTLAGLTVGTDAQVLTADAVSPLGFKWAAATGTGGGLTSVGLTVPTGFAVSGSPLTANGTLGITFASGYSLPSDSTQSGWTAKQAALVSGTNIKTINSNSLLGAGNLEIGAGGTMDYPGAGVAVSLGTSWGTSLTSASVLNSNVTPTSLGLVIGTNVLAQRTFGTAANSATTDFATAAQGATADAAVPKALFDANTILYATTDNTPVALTIPASTIVGRKSTGNIIALTGAEALAIIGAAAASHTHTGSQFTGFTQYKVTVGSAAGGLESAASMNFNGSTLAITGAITASGDITAYA